MPLAVVEDHLKHPVGALEVGLRNVRSAEPVHGRVQQQGLPVAVPNPLEVAVRSASPMPFVRGGEVHAVFVLGDVRVLGGVAPVAVPRAQQPAEDPRSVGGVRVGDARMIVQPVHAEHVVLADRAPVCVTVAGAGPPLDEGEPALDAWAVPAHRIPEPIRVRTRYGDEVVGASQCEDVGVGVLRHALVAPPRDHGDGQLPAEAERAVTGRRVVPERQFQPEARPRLGQRDRNQHRRGARDWVSGELLPDAADSAAADGQRDRGWAGRTAGGVRVAGRPPDPAAPSRRTAASVPRVGTARRATDPGGGKSASGRCHDLTPLGRTGAAPSA